MRWLLRLVSLVVFRLPGGRARKFHEFALAEQGSLLSLRLAASQTTDVRRRALYLRHAADEARHARMFLAAVGSAGPRPHGIHADAEDLFARLGEIDFLAFVFHAERRGRRRFELYRDLFASLGDTRAEALFRAIVEDERRHEAHAWQELLTLVQSPERARRAVLRARAWEAWRAFRRLGRRMANAIYVALMLVLYVLLFPLAWLTLRVRPLLAGFHAFHAGEEES